MNKRILNLGCGKGQNIPLIINRGAVICVDVDSESLEQAELRFPQCSFVHSRAEDLFFENEFFDEIYCFDVLEHVDDFDLVMKKISCWLKRDGELFVEIPYDKSERMLLSVNSGYFNQIGHKRIFNYSTLDKEFDKLGFRIISRKKTRGIVNLYLWSLFKLGIGLDDQMSSVKGKNRIIERCLFLFTIWFDKNLFNTFLKWIPIWIITLPFGLIISVVYPKTIALVLRKA